LYNSNYTTVISRFKANLNHYSVSSSGALGYDSESIFSGYNARWHNITSFSGDFYRLGGLSPSRFFVCVNSFYHKIGLFINLYDTEIVLHTDHFMEYINILKLKDIFVKITPHLNIIVNF
jgi:hypothetical protein